MSQPLNFALSATEDAYGAPGRPRIGRRAAGDGFLAAAARSVGAGEIFGFGAAEEEAAFRERVARANPAACPRFIDSTRPERLAEPGALFVPGPDIAHPAWRRARFAPCGWSLVGVTHSLAGAVAMDALAACAGGAVEAYDAIVCTSQAARAVAERVFAAQEEHLRRRLGATRFVRPLLPVIPLGVDVDRFRPAPERREAMRAALRIGAADVAVLSVGRLDPKTKAHHLPLLAAMARAAAEGSGAGELVLVLAGATGEEGTRGMLREAAGRIAPRLRVEVLPDPDDERLRDLYAASDLFVSLSDNIQETFGLAVLEAMASGLPCIVSDWDGYRDSVREGIDGFRAPTMIPPPALGEHLADLYDARRIAYRDYAGGAAALTVVDIEASAHFIDLLTRDQALRSRFGAAARERAVSQYAWAAVIARYRELAAELALARGEAASRETARRAQPARLSPFDVFRGHASAVLTVETRITAREPTLLEAALLDESCALRTMPQVAELVLERLGEETASLAELHARCDGVARGLISACVLALAKAGVLALLPGASASPRS